MMLAKPFHYQIRVYYEDTDLGGVVYHANYIKFFERARTEWLRAMGIEQEILIEQNLAFAVVNIKCDFRQPARFNDLVEVVTHVSDLGRASMTFSQDLYLQNDPESLLCRAEIKVACIKLDSFKSTALPALLLQQLKQDKQ